MPLSKDKAYLSLRPQGSSILSRVGLGALTSGKDGCCVSKHPQSSVELFNSAESIKSRRGRGWGFFLLIVLFTFGLRGQAPLPLPRGVKTADAQCNLGLPSHQARQAMRVTAR